MPFLTETAFFIPDSCRCFDLKKPPDNQDAETRLVENREKVRDRQVQYVYKYLPVSIVANIANGLILVVVHWSLIPSRVLCIWLFCLTAVNLLRGFSYRAYQGRRLQALSSRAWAVLYTAFLFLAGAVWGSAGLFLFAEENVVSHIFIVFALGGMTAGAAASTSALRGAFYFYCLPVLTPVTVRYFLFGDKVHLAMGLLTLIYAFFSISTARHVHQVLYDSINLLFENEHEIDSRKKAEESLRRTLERIEEKVEERTAELLEANQRLKVEVGEREQAEKEKKNLITSLEQALSEVKALSGLLPICAACKKIRDDRGYWNQIESYISEHSDAVFSHSICPDCIKRLYPEIGDDLTAE